MELRDQISERARQIRTDGYGMSIGEVISLYKEKEIDIHPEFQRIFRWNAEQKSRLIESILLGIPVPSIFVSQREDGVWDVIDVVQRLSTILEFVGEYVDENGSTREPFSLLGGEYLSEMEGHAWRETDSPHQISVFDDVLRRDFRRAKLEFRIIMKESDPQAKFDLFQRLNSGSILSQQEARNCLMVMINKDMYEHVAALAKDANFSSCVLLSDRQEEQAYREELVLRFFCQLEMADSQTELRKEYGEFITDWMRTVAGSGTPLDEPVFEQTFGLLDAALGEDAFRRWDGNRHLGPFSISSFEFITTGIASNLEVWSRRSPESLRSKVESVWTHEAYKQNSGTGVSPRRRVPRLVPESRAFFES